MKAGNFSYRYRDSKTRQWAYKTVSGAKFLWLVLQHVLPRRFRRTRNFGFLHPNSKRLIQLLQRVLRVDPAKALALIKKRPAMRCPCCGGEMKVIKTRLEPIFITPAALPT